MVTPCAYTVFRGSGGDVDSYFLGGEFDVVHGGLLGLMTAYVHHLGDVVFVIQVTAVQNNQNLKIEVRNHGSLLWEKIKFSFSIPFTFK